MSSSNENNRAIEDEDIHKFAFEAKLVIVNLKHALRTARVKRMSAGLLTYVFMAIALAFVLIYFFPNMIQLNRFPIGLIPALVLVCLYTLFETIRYMLHFSGQASQIMLLLNQLDLAKDEVKDAQKSDGQTSRLDMALKGSRSATRNASRVLAVIQRSSTKYSSQSSSALYGVAGGLFGMGVAFLISASLQVSLAAIGLILTGLGITVGILIYRERREIDLDSHLEENRFASQELLNRIRAIEGKSPKFVLEQLWVTYLEMNSASRLLPTSDGGPAAPGNTDTKPAVDTSFTEQRG